MHVYLLGMRSIPAIVLNIWEIACIGATPISCIFCISCRQKLGQIDKHILGRTRTHTSQNTQVYLYSLDLYTGRWSQPERYVFRGAPIRGDVNLTQQHLYAPAHFHHIRREYALREWRGRRGVPVVGGLAALEPHELVRYALLEDRFSSI
jgi:hypothetical protein